MHQQAQLRLKKNEVEKLGADVYVVVAMDFYRTRDFKEENLLLSRRFGSLRKGEEPGFYHRALRPGGTRGGALRGRAEVPALGSLGRESAHWLVIDRKGLVTLALAPKFDTPNAYVNNVDLVLEALRQAAADPKSGK